ncbi:MAG TPA: CopG family transcriptional regulator [Thermoanaerobaculia bacterium]|nr:CopG family transcriptional regulator [Thermoanaerobaculia bacterium]
MSYIKTSLNLSEPALDALKEMAAKRGVTVAEVVRQAIATEKFLLDEVEKGNKILIEDRDSRLRQIVFR